MDPLSQVVADAAQNLTVGILEASADAVENEDGPSFAARQELAQALTVPDAEPFRRRLLAAWERCPETDGQAIALALRAVALTAEAFRREQQVEIVWTGPPTPAVPVRTSRAALTEVIEAADDVLTLFAYAASDIADVEHELARIAPRVTIRLVLETATGADHELSSLAGCCEFFVWPEEQRSVPPGRSSAMHAKAALADDHTVLVTSANLTSAALQRNMELGLLVRFGRIPRDLAAHVDALIDRGVLVPHHA